jgi:hypothetical protein
MTELEAGEALRQARERERELELLIEKLRAALAYAIKEADGWYDDARGGQIDSPEMDAARKLLSDSGDVRLLITEG